MKRAASGVVRTRLRVLLGLVAVVALPHLAGCLPYHAGTLPEAPEATFLTLRGTSIRYVDEGPRDAPVVVLVHGFASSIGVWTGVREALRDRYRVLALDLKGFGHSGRPEGDYSPEEQARIVLALMDARSVHRAAFVAHSYGSSVALKVALVAPERVERVALYDAWVYAEQLPTTFRWARARGVGEMIFAGFYAERTEDKIALAFHDPEIIPQALVDDVEEQVRRPGTRAAALASVRAMRFETQQTHYREIEQPVLLLWGREDAVTTLEVGERLSNDLANARLEIYPLCGHFPMIEAARPSTRDLLAFLQPGAATETSTARSTAPTPAQTAPAPQPDPTADLGDGSNADPDTADPSDRTSDAPANEPSDAGRNPWGTR